MTSIFLDTADIEEIRKWRFLIEGVTTNPSIIRNDSGDIKDILQLCEGIPVSIEVGGDLISEANKLREWLGGFENIVYKVPFLNAHTNSHNLEVIKNLIEDGFKINCTAVLSLSQFYLVSKLEPTYISVFGGRIEDEGGDLFKVVESCQEHLDFNALNMIRKDGKLVEQIVGSIRTIGNVRDCIKAEVDIITVSPSILEKMVNHSYAQKTSEQFESDYIPVDTLRGISESSSISNEALEKLVGK